MLVFAFSSYTISFGKLNPALPGGNVSSMITKYFVNIVFFIILN